MNKLFFLFLTTAFLASASEITPVRFISLSPQIFPSTAEDPLTGLEWALSLSSHGNPNAINHELRLVTGNHGFSHEGTFILQDPFTFEPYVLPFALDIPPIVDINENGLDDFFDPDVPVDNITTEGRHPNFSGDGEYFFATWFRNAGDSFGSVTLNFPFFGLRFNHVFQLARYAGEFSFDRTATNLPGTLALTNVFDPQDRITGPLTLEVVNTNTLSYQAAAWDNGTGVNYVVMANFFLGRAETNFISYWILEDGYLATGELDYLDWLMVISSADANHNGQLDLTEGTATPTERPILELIKLPAGGIQITLRGIPGQTYALESVNAISGSTWQIAQTITLATATETITVTGSGARRFYRLRLQ